MRFPRQNKFNARKTVVDGIRFDSKKEADRYVTLRLLERAGAISGLERQVRIPCVVCGVKVCEYVGDFRYQEGGKKVVEDVKSAYTRKLPLYRLKKKLVSAIHGIDIREV